MSPLLKEVGIEYFIKKIISVCFFARNTLYSQYNDFKQNILVVARNTNL